MPVKTRTEIKTDVERQLIWDPQVFSDDVAVDVSREGEVLLIGTVSSLVARRAAERDAWNVYGVTAVDNQITVVYPDGYTIPSDNDLKTRIENALLWNPSIDSSNIDIDVSAGMVTIKGSVDAFWKKVRAETLVQDIVGVLNVVNELTIVPTKDFVDQDIAREIEEAIDRKVYVDVEDVTVEVENGYVTLSGTVPSYTAWSGAYDSAQFTPGVKEVRDNLRITYV